MNAGTFNNDPTKNKLFPHGYYLACVANKDVTAMPNSNQTSYV